MITRVEWEALAEAVAAASETPVDDQTYEGLPGGLDGPVLCGCQDRPAGDGVAFTERTARAGFAPTGVLRAGRYRRANDRVIDALSLLGEPGADWNFTLDKG